MMFRNSPHHTYIGILLLGYILCTIGCLPRKDEIQFERDGAPAYNQDFATEIEYPDVDEISVPEFADSLSPRTLENPYDQEPWNLTLEETVRLALANSKVIRNLGGGVLRFPDGTRTSLDPALVESDPNFGVEAALSDFDAKLDSIFSWKRLDRPTNSTFPGVFAGITREDGAAYTTELSKTTASGTKFILGHNLFYNETNSPSRVFDSASDVDYGITVRHPLLQGAGVEFNRIAGPNSVPGEANGVLISRMRTDITLADFEVGVRNFVSDVENAYWDLYFAYRDLDAKIAARDSALEVWRDIEKRIAAGAEGGNSLDETQAREQYFEFRAAVKNALSGRSAGRTLTSSTAGSLVGAGGVYAREANLRYLMGLAPNDGRLIMPANQPTVSKIVFDWGEVVNEARVRRAELRRQNWIIKKREMELIAARNFMLPRLDAIAGYKWLGFGDHLISTKRRGGFDNAYEVLTRGDYAEWELGVQLTVPIGFRREAAAVRNAELKLARERIVLHDQELELIHRLDGAVREVQRAHQLVQTNYNRFNASTENVNAWMKVKKAGEKSIDQLLRAQRRNAIAEITYHQSVIEYNLALKNMHFQKGSLLQYNGVLLAEGPWSEQSQYDAFNRSKRFKPRALDFRLTRPGTVSRGPYMQFQEWQDGSMSQDLDVEVLPPVEPKNP